MVAHDTGRGCEDSPVGDVAYLTRSEHRVSTLVALTEQPRSRSELCELTGVSSSTMRRTLGEFENRTWVRKEEHRYVATRLGETIAAGIAEMVDRVETERKLRDVWHWLPDRIIDFTVETAETTVTVAEYDNPYRPINRFKSLLQEAERFRFLGVDFGLYEQCNEALSRQILDGMRAEVIGPSSVARELLSTCPERCARLFESDDFVSRLHDDPPPYGLSLFDDRVAVAGYDLDSGGVKVLIDTDTPEAHEWAESVYTDYRSEARRLEPEQVLE